LEQTSPERNPVHRVKQEIDTEVCVEEKHAELLNTPQIGRCRCLPQGVKEKNIEPYRVTETKKGKSFVKYIMIHEHIKILSPSLKMMKHISKVRPP
jgi:hypothetical protein